MKKSTSLRALLALAFATLLGLTTVACQDDDIGDEIENAVDEIEDAVD